MSALGKLASRKALMIARAAQAMERLRTERVGCELVEIGPDDFALRIRGRRRASACIESLYCLWPDAIAVRIIDDNLCVYFEDADDVLPTG